MKLQLFGSLLFGGLAAHAQTFLSEPKGTTVVPSKRFDGASISYKENSLCETTKGVKSYSGYVNIPKHLLQDAVGWKDSQSAHLFFWYFEARHNSKNAPTSIFLGGGPGTSSIDAASGFPCHFNPDGNSTTLNDWSWNSDVNMLYIDQPVGTGFSYSIALNGTLDLVSGIFTPVADEKDLPKLNLTTVSTTADSGAVVTNTTQSAARTLWQFTQIWTQEFPEWDTSNDELSLWGVSYGGFWGTSSFSHFLDQNDLVKSGSHSVQNATVLNLGTLGLNGGAYDLLSQVRGFPDFAVNNTYGIKAISDETYTQAIKNLTAPDVGCYALADKCRALAKAKDPKGFGNVDEVNQACVAASNLCFTTIQGAYIPSGRDVFDITNFAPAENPREYPVNFYNQRWVQEELGAAVNFTLTSAATSAVFFVGTGDSMITSMSNVEHILDSGVNVALIHGDRDYRCNWFGAENMSLSMTFESSSKFRAAGYASIVTNSTYDGGFVRQQGNFSFARIFEAGHESTPYQPETMYRVFQRAMFRNDLATGKIDLASEKDYATKGPVSVKSVKSKVPEPLKNVCVIYDVVSTCTEEQQMALLDGSAIVENSVVTKPAGVTGEEKTASGDQSGGGKSNKKDDTSSGDKLNMSYALFAMTAAGAVALMVL